MNGKSQMTGYHSQDLKVNKGVIMMRQPRPVPFLFPMTKASETVVGVNRIVYGTEYRDASLGGSGPMEIDVSLA